MRAEFEAFIVQEWQQGSIWQIILRPLSWLFAFIAAFRRFLFRAGISKITNIRVPVIIVGNISAGGTGKTPLVLALDEALTKHGKHCGIVTRGYHRHSNDETIKVMHVLPTNPDGTVRSDEATMLARRSGVPVYAGANRVEAARALLRNHSEVDVIISDDG